MRGSGKLQRERERSCEVAEAAGKKEGERRRGVGGAKGRAGAPSHVAALE